MGRPRCIISSPRSYFVKAIRVPETPVWTALFSVGFLAIFLPDMLH